MTKDIHIVLSSSNEFMPYCATAMVSVLENVSKERYVHFYILSYDISPSSKKIIEKIKRKNKCSITYTEFDETILDTFNNIHTPPHVSKMTYARCFIPTFLPDVDKAIFLDCDIIVRTDISELYDIDLGNYYFGAVEDIGTAAISQRLFQNNDCYYTCGVLLINCKQMRKDNYLEKLKEINPERSKLYLLCDQDILNDIFHNKFYKISFRWDFYHEWHFYKKNFTPSDPEDYAQSLKNPGIIHYVGPDKPWYPVVKHPFKKEYMLYYKKNPFYNKFKIFYFDNYKTRYEKHKVLRIYNWEILSYRKYFNQNSMKKMIRIKFLGIPLFKKTKSPEKKAYYILAFPVYKKKTDQSTVKKYILGIRVKKTKKNVSSDALLLHINEIAQQNRFLLDVLHNKMNLELRSIHMAISHTQALTLHKDMFEKYRNSLVNQDVVLVGCGPSIEYYKPIPNAVHVGVNRAFKKDNIKFDFIFAQDEFPEGMEEFNNYPCDKFYGWLPNERAKEVSNIVQRIFPHNFAHPGIHKYIIEDIANGHWAFDLTTEPFGDFQGCCFSALQFICFCNPKRIYFVGCDCSSSQNKNLQVNNADLTIQLKSWQLFKNNISPKYPQTEIISVNPVGLKGLFRDVYTKEYLKDHPEIEQDVEILDI